MSTVITADRDDFCCWYHRMHHLWTKAVGTADYVKSEWKQLERQLLASSAEPPCDAEALRHKWEFARAHREEE